MKTSLRPSRESSDSRRGAILLIAIMVSSVVLAVGFGIYQRTYKQILLGSFWRQIQIAFAAADAGLECAVYWDKFPTLDGTEVSCFGKQFVWKATAPAIDTVVTQTSVYPGKDEQLTVNGGCVELRVVKVHDPDPLNVPDWTYIDVAGYNDACGSTSPRRVNRIRWIKYED